jgi:hypothetical protein
VPGSFVPVDEELYVPEGFAGVDTASEPAPAEANTARETESPEAGTSEQPASPGVSTAEEPAAESGPSSVQTLGWLIAVAVGVAIFVVAWRAYTRTAVTPPSTLRGFLF